MTTTQNAPVTQAPNAPVNNPAPQIKIGYFGDGKYSPLMGEVYSDAQRIFNLSDKAADKAARRVARDLGDVMVNKQSIGYKQVKFGKVNDDNKLTISEAATKVKNCTQTEGVMLLRCLFYINDAGNNGLDNQAIQWATNKVLTTWFSELEQ